MSIASRGRSPPFERPDEEIPADLFDLDHPFFGREDPNTRHPAFDVQMSNDGADHIGADDDLEEDDIPRRRVLRGIPPSHVPSLDQRRRPVAHALTAELIQETAGRDRFRTVTPSGLMRAADTFVRYRVTSLDFNRHTDRGARRMFLSDSGGLGRLSFSQMELVMQLMARFAPQIMKSRANSNDPMFGEIVLPGRLRNLPDAMSPMGLFSSRTS